MTSAVIEVTTGDPVVCLVQLTKITDAGEISFDIPINAVVKAALVDRDKETKLTADSTCDSAAADADWSQSLVYVDIPKTETENITQRGPAWLELQVFDQIEITWHIPITIQKGHIS